MKKQDITSLSRRQWLERMAIPAFTVAGASLIGTKAAATALLPPTGAAEEKMLGARTYNVRDYGAKGDGKTLDTTAVQAAIDACHQDKGGTVLVPAGDFLIGTVELKSNVTLQLSVQGRLLGSARREDYQAGNGVPPGNGNVVLLYAVNAENIAVEGRGTIDGNGVSFNNGKGDGSGPGGQKGGNIDRPHLVIFYKCSQVLIRDAFFTRSAYHCFRILQCKHVNIDGIRIYNRVNRNNDGFHFNSSQYVHITNCDIACQDDGCALFGSNQFVTVTNCTFSTRWSIFRFGSGDAKHIAISNCLIYDTYGCPVKISANRSHIEDLTFSNIIMKNVTGPIGIGFNAGSNTGCYVRNVVFNGIRATVVPKPVNHPDIPFDVKPFDGEQLSCITLNGAGNSYLEDISFTDVHVVYAGGGSAALAAKRDIPQIAVEYFGVWGKAPFGPPSYGLYARNVKGLTLQNVRLEYEQADLRPAVVFDNVSDASINGLSVQGHPDAESVLRFINSKDVLLTAARMLAPAPVFLRVEGNASEGILVDGGDLRKAGRPLELAAGAADNAVKLRT